MPSERASAPPGFRILDPRDTFEKGVGPFLVPEDVGDDFRALLKVEERHCNASGVVHGGLLMTMADATVCTVAIQGMPGERAITVSLTADFVAAAELGELLEARARIVQRTGSLVFMRGDIAVEGRTVLTCSAVIKRIRRS